MINKPKPLLTSRLTILCLKGPASKSTPKSSLKTLKLSKDTTLKIWWKILNLLGAKSSNWQRNQMLNVVWAPETGRGLTWIALTKMFCSHRANKTRFKRMLSINQQGTLGLMSILLRQLLSGRILKTYMTKPSKGRLLQLELTLREIGFKEPER